jgi:Mrp family chromosome partitioning ATPase
MIRRLKDDYDHIIIDSPPFGIISDAAPLIGEADGVILVARFNQTKDPELDLTIDNLKKVKANVIGTVMTAFDPKKSTGYYYSSYYYKYAYESYDKYHEEA